MSREHHEHQHGPLHIPPGNGSNADVDVNWDIDVNWQ